MEKKKSFRARLAKNIQKNWILYVMMLPVVIYYIVFAYAPIMVSAALFSATALPAFRIS